MDPPAIAHFLGLGYWLISKVGVSSLDRARYSRNEESYFGRTTPPNAQKLVYLIGAEPASLDPAKSIDLWELYIAHSLFEGLTTRHPATGEPMNPCISRLTLFAGRPLALAQTTSRVPIHRSSAGANRGTEGSKSAAKSELPSAQC